tara:strand:- start:363 stop:704 length:342 start_codon:yes stop_codon:yes gene_type:complete
MNSERLVPFEDVESLVWLWAKRKGITGKENAHTQMGKMLEEVMELDKEVGLNDIPAIKDELGDVLVTCIVQAACHGLDPVECLQGAYEKIRKRKGDTVNGVFIKDMEVAHDAG